MCPQRQDDTNQEPLGEALGEKSTELFSFFSFSPEGSGASRAETSTNLQWGARGPAAWRSNHGKVPATHIGSGFPGRGGSVEVSTLCAIWDRGGSDGFLWAPSNLPLPFQMDIGTAQSKLASGFPARGRSAYFCCSCLYLPVLLG